MLSDGSTPEIVEGCRDKHGLGIRLLGLAWIGCFLEARDGHIWIEEFHSESFRDGSLLHRWLQTSGIALNNKIYGGVLEALDTVDEALKMAGRPSLTSLAEDGYLFLGLPGVDASRISRGEPGTGGIY